MNQIEPIKGSVSSTVNRAIAFAMKAHAGQTRKYTGEPYIVHPLRVAGLIQARGFGPDMCSAAVLHDVIEDCGVTRDHLESEFGIMISLLVDELTNKTPKLGSAQSIKLADIIDNCSTIVEVAPASEARAYLRKKAAQLIDLTNGDPVLSDMAWSTLARGFDALGMEA